jgi:periplasmic protein TonB
MSDATRDFHVPAASASTLWLSAAVALGVHACVLFAWRVAPREPPLIEVEGDSVEIALVESAPSAPAAEAAPEPPPPAREPPPPEPVPIPTPKPTEMVLPELPKATPAPKSAAPPKPARSMSRSKPNAAPNATTRGTGGTATAGSGGGATGAGEPAGKPAFIARPAAAYPSESRAAGEQGVVILRITVNAGGRPTAVSVRSSSGYPRLDRAAVEGGWRCRVSNPVAGAQFDAPVRFNLRD